MEAPDSMDADELLDQQLDAEDRANRDRVEAAKALRTAWHAFQLRRQEADDILGENDTTALIASYSRGQSRDQ